MSKRKPSELLHLTTDEAAAAFNVTPATIRDWARRGLIQRAGGSPRKPLWRGSDLLAAHGAPRPRRASLTVGPPDHDDLHADPVCPETG